MTNLLLLPPSAWRVGDGVVSAAFCAPSAGGLAVLAEGWSDPGLARLVHADGMPQPFLPLATAAFVATAAPDGAAFTIEAPAPPQRCRVMFVPRPANSPSLALLAPRAIRSPLRHAIYDLVAGQRRTVAALAAQDLDTALGVVAEMLAAARGAVATQAAIVAVLAHLTCYPLARSPALGAFVAALTE